MASKNDRIPCPCCGRQQVGDYEFCHVCGWQNDDVQADDPDFCGGPNHISLNKAKANYTATGWFDPKVPKFKN